MLVTRVVSPVSSRESWTVVGDDDRTVEPVELYLAYLTGVERSPNTVKAYAHDLKDWFEFLADRELDWRAVILEDIGAFVDSLQAGATDGSTATRPPRACTGVRTAAPPTRPRSRPAPRHPTHNTSQSDNNRPLLNPPPTTSVSTSTTPSTTRNPSSGR